MKIRFFLKYVFYIILVVLLSFLLPRIIPGSPLSYSHSDTYILNQSLPEETFNAFTEYYAPNETIIKQLYLYIKNLLSFDLGYSFYYKLPVSFLIMSRLPWTVMLASLSLIISTIIAIKFGIRSSLNNKNAKLKIGFMLGIQSTPTFLIAVLIQGFLAYKLKLFPAWGAYTPGIEFFTPQFYLDVIKHIALPMLTLVLCEIPGIYILAYNSDQKIKKENYVTMAYYLNIDEKSINRKYILKNIIPEILGKLNIQVIYAITGSLFVESIFSYPGLGQLLKNATSSRDYPLIQGLLILVCMYGLIVSMIFEIILKKNSLKY